MKTNNSGKTINGQARSLRLALALMMAVLFIAFAACDRLAPKPVESPAPATEAPTESPAPATEAPTEQPDGVMLVFVNGLEAAIEGVHISSSNDSKWNDALNANVLASGKQLTIPFSAFLGVDGERYDIGVIDENGMNYDCYKVTILAGDRIELTGDAEEASFIVLHADGTREELEAKLYTDGGADDKDSVILNVGIMSDYDWAWDSATEKTVATYSRDDVTITAPDGFDGQYFTALDLALSRMNLRREEESRKAFESFSERLREDLKERGEDFASGSYTESAFVRRADSKLMSILFEVEMIDGEGSGYTYYSENFNPATGETIKLSDVVSDVKRLPAILNEKLAPMNEDGFTFDTSVDYSARFDDPQREFAWTFDHDGLSFFFNYDAFDIEDAKPCTVVIEFDLYPDLVKTELVPDYEDYAIAFPWGTTNFFNIDGEIKRLSVSGRYIFELGIIDSTQIYVEDDVFEDNDFSGYEMRPVFVHADGSDYIYLRGSGDNDYRYLSVYKLNGKVKKLANLNCSFRLKRIGAFEEDGYYVEQQLVDPTCFEAETRTEIMGTTNGWRYCSIGEDGLPKGYTDYYLIEEMKVFMPLREIEMKVVDTEGKLTGEAVTVDTGYTLGYLRTDNDSYADLVTGDGTILRIELSYDSGIAEHNGIPVTELFDGITFAG